MSLLDSILNNPQIISQVAARFGIDPAEATAAIQKIVPALAGGLHAQLSSQGAQADAVKAMVEDGTHQQMVENPSAITEHNADAGHAILSHLLGSHDVKAELAQKVAQETGVNADTLKQMMPTLAAVVMGAASKQLASHGSTESFIGSISHYAGEGTLVGGLLNMIKQKIA